MAAAAATVHAQVTTVQFASGVAGAQGAVVLSGSGISSVTGNFLRYLWTADPVNGLCRIDPDVDSPGPRSVNPATCLTTAAGAALKAGQLSFDANTNNIYAVDLSGKSNGMLRLHFIPSGDSGSGLIDKVHVEVVGAACGIGQNNPTAAALGPDGNLYVGFKRVTNIMRILSPQTEPLPCQNVQATVISAGQNIVGLGWAGHNLFDAGKTLTGVIANADVCFTPANGNNPCAASVFLPAIPPGVIATDQTFPSTTGSNVFVGATTSLASFNTASNTVTPNYGGATFSFIGALAVDTRNPASPVVYVGDDPSNGLSASAGRWFQISTAPPPPAAPGTPANVTATAGQGAATVSWTPATDGQTVTSFTVHNSSASNGVLAPDVVVTAAPGTTIVPASATISGLTVGVTYQFEVLATNPLGSSALSAPSNPVTPFALRVPGAPTNIVATAGDASALVAWTAPASNGNSTITSYTVTALVGGVVSGITATVAGTATGANVTGLANGVTYTFTVHATNAIGDSAESTPSAPVTPAAPPPVQAPDMSITMSGPASATFGTSGTYILTVVNNSTSVVASQVNVTDAIPLGATLASAVPSQGACSVSGATLTCQLGSMGAGAVATITVTLNLSGTITTQASVVALDAGGSAYTDPTPANNTASVTTTVAVPPTTTDVQVTGSAQNGGPAHGSTDTFTWQVKDNTNVVANAVQFSSTLPASFQFLSASANAGGVCVTPAPNSFGGTITCRTSSLPGGQTMTVVVNFVATTIGTIPTTGSATFNGTDTNTANNSFTVTIQVK
jgi:uncharacterized repeat protein (TIGR01451 family)